MQGRRFQETGGVVSGIGQGFLGTENDGDAGRSFAQVEWHDSNRLLGWERRGLRHHRVAQPEQDGLERHM